MSHRLRIIVHDLPIMSVCVESIDRYFAEEHPQGQEIAIDKGSDQLLENDYRYMIGMGNIDVIYLDFDRHMPVFTVVSCLRFKAYGP